MKALLFVICFFNFFSDCYSQENNFKTIYGEMLFSAIRESDRKFFVVEIFTSYCSGTNDIANDKRIIDSITNNQTEYFLCQSLSSQEVGDTNPIAEIAEKKGLNKNDIYIIDDKKYRPGKKDGRLQGMKFRDEICDQCRLLITGVPLKIIFDKNLNILFYGFKIKGQQLAAILSCEN